MNHHRPTPHAPAATFTERGAFNDPHSVINSKSSPATYSPAQRLTRRPSHTGASHTTSRDSTSASRHRPPGPRCEHTRRGATRQGRRLPRTPTSGRAGHTSQGPRPHGLRRGGAAQPSGHQHVLPPLRHRTRAHTTHRCGSTTVSRSAAASAVTAQVRGRGLHGRPAAAPAGSATTEPPTARALANPFANDTLAAQHRVSSGETRTPKRRAELSPAPDTPSSERMNSGIWRR